MTVVVVDPLTRIEGHLRLTAEVNDGVITNAHSSGTMYRGFEQILKGRDPRDASRITQRICGVCPTCHSIASVNALDDAFGITGSIPKDALVVRNILQGLNAIASHATHIWVLWLPDLAHPTYKMILETVNLKPVWDELVGRFAPISYSIEGKAVPPGSSYLAAIPEKKALQEAEAILGGKMPHQMATIVGGVTCTPTLGDIGKIASYYVRVMEFVNHYALGLDALLGLTDPLEVADAWLELTHDVSKDKAVSNVLDILGSLPTDDFSREAGWSDVALFAAFGSELIGETLLGLPASLKLDTIGGYPVDPTKIGFLSYGWYYAIKEGYDPTSTKGERFITSGFTSGDLKYENFNHLNVTEHVAHSFYTSGNDLHPWNGETEPVKKAADIKYDDPTAKYSWLKAPRYKGIPCEVGPLSRMINAKEPLVMGLAEAFLKNGYSPANVYTRMLARAQEIIILARELKKWVLIDLDPNGKFYTHADLSMAKDSKGAGLWEGPRGALGHWIVTDGDSRIKSYQPVVPSTWNLSPRDANGKLGPTELGLVGSKVGPIGNVLSTLGAIPLSKEVENPTAIFHVGRSYDPCLACAVHTIDKRTNKKYEIRLL
ncbi:MAG: nickel-dependent hydrogenase large subunit [Methanocellales archaeon]|nr:nickel-dependent hydrogenase large subunit [Methanocellales archaeon]MDD3292009.1 nickel-dependent hydrogenase large subunit [Methanocellales archaeon]MDD5235708.1 nickel-dependent hydrogenase large subunit [Methanocellales archaeon]MDD5485634.1 nickel-dependent hydrogenase large subunit [Methanocellales archaeon]